ncbi:hypothetical protein B0H11DRAFT_1908111 [Mycena galericulata]|nr:hypothetical protein B0H11DRAFT_1908111 [Mycena galericulata]
MEPVYVSEPVLRGWSKSSGTRSKLRQEEVLTIGWCEPDLPESDFEPDFVDACEAEDALDNANADGDRDNMDVDLEEDGPLGLAATEVIMRERWHDMGFAVGDDGSRSDSETGGDDDGREAGDSEDELKDEDGDAENPGEDIFDWDRFEAPGLSAWDRLGESNEAKAAIAHKLSHYDLAICKAFANKVKTRMFIF